MNRPPFDPRKIRGAADPVPPAAASALTVSQVTALIKRAVAAGLPSTVHVVGEISNLKRHSSGHVYLTLKDDSSELACVMWKSAASGLKFKPDNGLEIIATGQIDVFERAGRYQLYIRKMEPRGVGALELAFRQLQQKLQAQGLFDPEHKKRLPVFPRRIGVVTSPTGAAVRDILQTLQRRYPCADVVVFPVPVQGSGAAAKIAEALRLLDRRHRSIGGIDVLIVGRGGGSLEDLWAFNEEEVARAIFACSIPVVSAVGHEVDVTISDLVADVRAATPTAAAELVAPAVDDLLGTITQQQRRLTQAVAHRLGLARAALDGAVQRRVYSDPVSLVGRPAQIVDELASRVSQRINERMHGCHAAVSRCEVAIQRIHPRSFVARTGERLTEMTHRLRWALSQRAARGERALQRWAAALSPTVLARQPGLLAERVARLERQLLVTTKHRFQIAAAGVEAEADKLQAISYRTTLARGFSITRLKRGRKLVRDASLLKGGDRLLTETASGEVESTVVDRKQLELFE